MCREKTDSKGNVLFRGERERNDGRYEYRYTDHRGVQHSVYENRLQQLRMEEAKIAYREHKGLLYGLKELLLNDVFDMWLPGKAELKHNTIRGYRQLQGKYYNDIGGLSIHKLTTEKLQRFISSVSDGRSAKTVSNIY